MDVLADMMQKGRKLTAVIDRRYKLEPTAEAIGTSSKGHARGKG